MTYPYGLVEKSTQEPILHQLPPEKLGLDIDQIARDTHLAMLAAYLAWKRTGGEGTFESFTKKVFDYETELRSEEQKEISKEFAETRAALQRNQTLGPKIMYEILTKEAIFIGGSGAPITKALDLLCPTCKKYFDWTKEAEISWRSIGGERVSAPEKDLRRFIEMSLFQPGRGSYGLFCHHKVKVHNEGHDGRAVLGSEREQPCGAKLLGDYRVVKKTVETKPH